jgi:maltooligosyltrehalose trehalohydrolase
MQTAAHTLPLGANLTPNGCEFHLWAPTAERVLLDLGSRQIPMQRGGEYFHVEAPAHPGDRYAYRVNGGPARPDPVSRSLPNGVHGWTEIVDPQRFDWTDRHWRGVPLRDYIIYELHVGTFSPEGTFDGVIARLDHLKNTLGVTAIELMPVAAFPGERNWGYDGASPYAVQASYGGPEGLRRLVDAAHAARLAVVLDVVYNHLGNEGNYLGDLGPYFTARHRTPWGNAVDFSQPAVREYFIENARYWLREYHLDGLRLDAVQTIYDDSPYHIVHDIAEAAHQLGREQGRHIVVIAESDENNPILVREHETDAFWSDDFHHVIHTLLTPERQGYYQDFGDLRQLAVALEDGYVFQGEHFSFWDAPRGAPPHELPLPANVICIQNHDQVGNRARGERLRHIVPSAAACKAAAALLLLAPHTPLLFMGQEYDETAPFQFFTSFSDPGLVAAVRKGRCEEFKDFRWDEVPDPQDPATYSRSKLHWEQVTPDNEILNWYQELIALRKEFVVPAARDCRAEIHDSVVSMQVPAGTPRLRVDVNFAGTQLPACGWERVLSATDEQCAVTVYRR